MRRCQRIIGFLQVVEFGTFLVIQAGISWSWCFANWLVES